MSVSAIRFGNLSTVKKLEQAQKFQPKELAQNFQNSVANGELVPKVRNEYLANKLDFFA